MGLDDMIMDNLYRMWRKRNPGSSRLSTSARLAARDAFDKATDGLLTKLQDAEREALATLDRVTLKEDPDALL